MAIRGRSIGRALAILTVASAAAGSSAGAQVPPTPAAFLSGSFDDAATARVDYRAPVASATVPCDRLRGLGGGGVRVVSVAAIAAGDAVPAHCRVTLAVSAATTMEIDLPLAWNGRVYMFGNGGPAGERPDDPPRPAIRDRALANGFVVAGTNAGHDRVADPIFSFLGDPTKRIDYAHRAVHRTLLAARRAATRFYGRRPAFAYWDGCSTGGREGLIAAQRYPHDFDGILAGAPAADFSGLLLKHLWADRVDAVTRLSRGKIALVGRAVLAGCDGRDGLRDGLIDDPRRCGFDPARDVPACAAGATGDDCLTPAEARAFAALYAGPRNRAGPLFPGISVGAEIGAAVPGGPLTLTGWEIGADGMLAPPVVPAVSQLAALSGDPAYDWHRFDVDRDLPLLAPLRRDVDATNPDLNAFRRAGGRMLLYYGWADTTLNPLMGLDYYQAAVRAIGPGTPDFFRLLMIPGMFHCRGGFGPDRFDGMSALIDWVERGAAPERIVARQIRDGRLYRSRPLCPFPAVARYAGKGSVDDAASFRCVAPAAGDATNGHSDAS